MRGEKAEEAVRDPEVAYVVFYDKEGKVAAFSGQGKPNLERTVPPLDLPDSSGNKVLVGDHLVTGDKGQGLDVIAPVAMPGSGVRWGSVRLGVRQDRIYKQIERTRFFIFLLGLVGTLVGWILAALFTQKITVPLKNLVNAVLEVSEGKYDVDLSVKTGDEVQDLAENFQQMVSRIKEGREALEANLKEIRELKHFSDLIILSITNGLMTLDEEGRIVTFNRKAEEILAVKSDDALGLTPQEVVEQSLL